MAAKNDITGDAIRSRHSATYADNYDRIFGKKTKPKYDINAEVKKVSDQLLDIANLCGRNDRMDLIPQLEQAYEILEQIK